ncbi:MAG: hypothetical protein KatS3mg102_1964 [Planctomycetota bacterium]|nr:MAG: hypothetical protein KatS3mg102_1964 [Planctomycetota bacterium]
MQAGDERRQIASGDEPARPPGGGAQARRARRRSLVVALLVVFAPLAALYWIVHAALLGRQVRWAAPPTAASLRNPIAATAPSIARGAALFRAHCAGCHGPVPAAARAPAATGPLRPLDLGRPEVQAQADGELFWKIGEGSPPMPSFERTLSAEDRWHLVNYLRALAEPGGGSPVH